MKTHRQAHRHTFTHTDRQVISRENSKNGGIFERANDDLLGFKKLHRRRTPPAAIEAKERIRSAKMKVKHKE